MTVVTENERANEIAIRKSGLSIGDPSLKLP
jgi:hypothetical protein